jgi:hypothetical protein
MNINEFLLNQTADILPEYDCFPDDFKYVLIDNVPFDERQNRAIRLIEGVLSKHGKQGLLSYVSDLAAVELGLRELEPGQRDHVVHAVRVFLLGVFINNTLLKDTPVDKLQWKLAGLTHDIGYPLEIASRIARPFGKKLNDIAEELGVNVPPVQYQGPRLKGIEILTRGKSGFVMIQDRLEEWDMPMDVKRVYEERTLQGPVCHGVISALAVLRVLDLLYAKGNPERVHELKVVNGIDWNQKWFETDNISACAAVFLHNLDPNKIKMSRLSRHKAPVAYLLRLADTLQEWDRPSGKLPNGLPPDIFKLDVSGPEIIYQVNAPDDMKEYLTGVLDATLEDHNIRIV